MIIDIHTHLGVVNGVYNMPLEKQLNAMNKYGVTYALISDITVGESYSTSATEDLQIKINQNAINQCLPYKDKLGVMLWCRANAEGFNSGFEKLYLENKNMVKGLKIHPDIASLPFNSEKNYGYLEMAQEHSLPVLIHTKQGDYSSVSFVKEVAEKFPTVKFILGHMDLCGDKTEPFKLIKELPNVYGDTAWVDYADALKAVEYGIGDKIMFGTDSPISPDTYGDYRLFFENADGLENILYKNAQRIFAL